jgi:hypothetical protein
VSTCCHERQAIRSVVDDERCRVSRTGRIVMEGFVWISGGLIFALMAFFVVYAFVKMKQRDRHYEETGELD